MVSKRIIKITNELNERNMLTWRFPQRRKFSCWICGSPRNLTRHHIIPLSEGGFDFPTNIVKICSLCHQKMHTISNLTEKEWNLRITKARIISDLNKEIKWIN